VSPFTEIHQFFFRDYWNMNFVVKLCNSFSKASMLFIYRFPLLIASDHNANVFCLARRFLSRLQQTLCYFVQFVQCLQACTSFSFRDQTLFFKTITYHGRSACLIEQLRLWKAQTMRQLVSNVCKTIKHKTILFYSTSDENKCIDSLMGRIAVEFQI